MNNTNEEDAIAPETAAIHAAKTSMRLTYAMGGAVMSPDGISQSGGTINVNYLVVHALSAALEAMADHEPQRHLADALRRYARNIAEATWEGKT